MRQFSPQFLRLTFLCQVIYSSLKTALRKLGSLYWGCTKHLAAATIDAVRGPLTPVAVRNSAILGVSRKGTGLFASNSPMKDKQYNLSTFKRHNLYFSQERSLLKTLWK